MKPHFKDDFDNLWQGIPGSAAPKESSSEIPHGSIQSNQAPRDIDYDEEDTHRQGPSKEELQTTLGVLKYFGTGLSAHQTFRFAYDTLLEMIETYPELYVNFDQTARAGGSSRSPQTASVNASPRWSDIINKLHSDSARHTPAQARGNNIHGPFRCYICQYIITIPSRSYPRLCLPCANFNLAASNLSAPPHLNLTNKTALVTGARVNLGYHTALRLLRCGANVIASSRYPWDAQQRYSREGDYSEWKGRLAIVGADFRRANDAFALVDAVKRQLIEWKADKLDILVNNAAQTLTDSVQKEGEAIKREVLIASRTSDSGEMMVTNSNHYQARIRGGTTQLLKHEQGFLDASPDMQSHSLTQQTTSGELQSAFKSSWAQSLFQIPYEDIITAHSINTFVPLILIRELLPLMGFCSNLDPPTSTTSDSEAGHGPKKTPLGYIINVSSRESIFESNPTHGHKAGHHVHTNMSKAALNMITETEAHAAWISKRVAMNTVDPGYMSAAPEILEKMRTNERDGEAVLPLSWEDGAGRVLWPIAVGEKEGQVVWGRFLKHYGLSRVEVGLGR